MANAASAGGRCASDRKHFPKRWKRNFHVLKGPCRAHLFHRLGKCLLALANGKRCFSRRTLRFRSQALPQAVEEELSRFERTVPRPPLPPLGEVLARVGEWQTLLQQADVALQIASTSPSGGRGTFTF